MGSQSAGWVSTARLLRCTGFGTTGAAVDAALAQGSVGYLHAALAGDPSDVGAAATPPPSFPPVSRAGPTATADDRRQRNREISQQLQALSGWWLRRMVAVRSPLPEKMTLCWHNHFATSATKVRDAGWMLAQNQTFRTLGRGDFGSLAQAMLTDAAMLRWLDGQQNTVGAPNENLAREFMELFTLGHGDAYTEADVREGARALTGWRIRPDGSTRLMPYRHDGNAKTVLGVTGNLDNVGFGAAVLAQPGCARYVASRLWAQIVSATPPADSTLDRLVAAYGMQRNLTQLVTAMLSAPEFRAAQGTLVITPVEWLVGALRSLRLPVEDTAAAKKLLAVLRELGQVPFYPPSVGGWPSGQAWLSTAAAETRMQAGSALTAKADLSPITDHPRQERVDAAGYLLGIGDWSPRSRSALQAEVDNPARLVTVALNTPEYLTI